MTHRNLASAVGHAVLVLLAAVAQVAAAAQEEASGEGPPESKPKASNTKLSDDEYEAITRRIMGRVVALNEKFPQLNEIPNGIVRKGQGGAGGLGLHYKVKWVLDDPAKPASKLNGRRAVYEKGGFWFHLTFYRGRYQGAAKHRPILFGDLRLWFDYGYEKDASVIAAVTKTINEEKSAFARKHPSSR